MKIPCQDFVYRVYYYNIEDYFTIKLIIAFLFDNNKQEIRRLQNYFPL